MPPFPDFRGRNHNDHADFKAYISVEEEHFQQQHIKFINAKHLNFNRPESHLPIPVRRLLMFLLDEYMPTGILHIDQINSAEDILNEIHQNLLRNQAVQRNLSKAFYELIPQNGDCRRLEIITTPRLYRNKIEVVSSLRSAVESIYAALETENNPIDYFKRYWLRTEFRRIEPESEEFQILSRCMTATQHPNEPVLPIRYAFKVTSAADIEFARDMENQRLLIHFTYPCNILGILRDGLQVAPRHVFSRNRFLGQGIYFWDCASMALEGFRNFPRKKLVLLVCRVALGNLQRVPHMYLDGDEVLEVPNDTNSLVCEGHRFSQVADKTIDLNGAKICCGQVDKIFGAKSFDDYNKYMILRKNQVKIEYILQFERNN